MKQSFLTLLLFLSSILLLKAADFNQLPKYKIYGSAFAFTYNGEYTGPKDFRIYPSKEAYKVKIIASPAKYVKYPINVNNLDNPTYSPDSTKIAYTKDNNLYVYDIKSATHKQLSFDGSELILNGYASWVYYEEIFGRPSHYKAFWWSPDSKKIAYYRFDNSNVPMFPIYSARGKTGFISATRYPKAGQPNPEVKIAIVNLEEDNVKWLDFNEKDDQYFGTPFWSEDSEKLFVSRMPRVQNTLELFSVSAQTTHKTLIYKETYKTWLNWIEDMYFGKKGLYMVRNFETAWDQLYYLSYDGKQFERLSDGENWRMKIAHIDEHNKKYYFTAQRDSRTRAALYVLDKNRRVKALTDTNYNVSSVLFSENADYVVYQISNYNTPTRIFISNVVDTKQASYLVADLKTDEFNIEKYAIAQPITIMSRDGVKLYANVIYPFNIDTENKQYPVHFHIYGGPDTPLVEDKWSNPLYNSWWAENGIIHVVADCRAAGHNGRADLDQIYRKLGEVEARDFVDWARYFQSLPYVKKDKIAVDGFSFGGTMTASLVIRHPDEFQYGIAGGGVYDWSLYDTHYTERYMDTPANNPKGYKESALINHVAEYKTRIDNTSKSSVEPVMLKLTHGTADDNVHFQNTLQLIDALQESGANFEFMIYPDEYHGYRGRKGLHSYYADRKFWKKYLLEK